MSLLTSGKKEYELNPKKRWFSLEHSDNLQIALLDRRISILISCAYEINQIQHKNNS